MTGHRTIAEAKNAKLALKRIAVASAAAAVALLLSAPTLSAHHGSSGKYDFTTPIFVDGTVVETRYGYPHAEIVVDVGSEPQLTERRSQLSVIEEVESRSTLSLLSPLPSGGETTVLLAGSMTRRATDSANRPEVGDRVVALGYRRVSEDSWTGELRAAAFRLTSGEVLTWRLPASYRASN